MVLKIEFCSRYLFKIVIIKVKVWIRRNNKSQVINLKTLNLNFKIVRIAIKLWDDKDKLLLVKDINRKIVPVKAFFNCDVLERLAASLYVLHCSSVDIFHTKYISLRHFDLEALSCKDSSLSL